MYIPTTNAEHRPEVMLDFIEAMGKPGTPTSYSRAQLLQMYNKALKMLDELLPYAANQANGIWLATVAEAAEHITRQR